MRLHVLGQSEPGSYTIVVHQATPAGNNSAGFSWASVLVAAGKAQSVLTVGTGPGQTTQAEIDAIEAGTIIEGVFGFTDNPAWSPAQRNSELDAQATARLSNLVDRLASELKWYGATRS